ncbi:MAG: FkbM family methyltransferase [Nanoarchaeota archaeon]|nr:FkbM family methyltransferase [Nanoarchaeota archaeon]
MYKSKNSFRNSTKLKVANRKGKKTDEMTIECTTLLDLFEQFSVPYYCKIDIEGEESNALMGFEGNIDKCKALRP